MKKVLVYAYDFPPMPGGSGSVAFDYCKELCKRGVDVTIVTSYLKNRQANEFNVISVKSIPKVRQYFFFKKIKTSALKKYDAIILNGTMAISMAALFFSAELQSKCLVYLHGLEIEYLVENKILRRLTGFDKKFIVLLNSAKAMVAVSDFIKNRIVNYLRDNSLEVKITVIPNAVNGKIFYEKRINLYEKLCISKNHTLLLSVSRVIKGKGFDIFLKQFKDILIADSNHHWIIVGDGDYLQEFKSLVKKYGLSPSISFTGALSREVLHEYYSSADVFVLLSQFYESFGLIYLEANACGLPVIGMNRGAVSEVIKNNETGFVIDSPEQIFDIIISKKYKRLDPTIMIEHALDRSWQKNTDTLLELI